MEKNSDNQICEPAEKPWRPSVEALDREIARQDRKDAYKRLTFGVLVGLVVAAAVIIVITNLFIAVLQVDGSSMNPLLQMGEVVIAARDVNPEQNDIIAFYHDNTVYIKRVIAVGGDLVNIDVNGVVSVNGDQLDEPYAGKLSLGSCDIDFPYQVPPETFFVLGDNRSVSLDSRDSQFGAVGRNKIIGIVKFSMWPPSRIGSVS